MSDESSTQRRAHLTAQIARQRGELTRAYTHLAKPLHYAEQGLKGLSFLRQNPWVFSVVPAAFTITSAVVGIVRNKPASGAAKTSRFTSRLREEEKLAAKAPKTIGGHVVKWAGHGWKAFTLYRKFKRFIP